MRRWPLWLAMAISLAFVNPYVRGDGNGYYAWLVSPVIDRDLDFANQYRHADPLFRGMMFDPSGRPRPEQITSTGRVANQWSVGPALLWSPWFLAAHGAVKIARLWSPGLAADGYSWPYRYACAIGTAVYGFLALVFARRIAVAVGRPDAATAATFLVWAASPLPVYQFFLPFHVHALAAFTVAWFIWIWLKPRGWLYFGAVAGLMTEVYQLNAVLLILAFYALAQLARREGIGRAVVAAMTFAAAFVIVWVPQLVGKAIVYGTPLTTGYHDQFFWLSPRLWQTAFSAEHGLFSWTPVAAIAAVGLGLLIRRRRDFWPLGAACVLFFVCVASYQNWHGQSAFGNRFFISLFAVAVAGTAELWARVRHAGGMARRLAIITAGALALWNAGLACQWGTDIIPHKGPVDFGVVARNQATIVPAKAIGFLKEYFTSRARAARAIEQRDAGDPHGYKVIR
jgi:hypothetical protein